MTILDEFEQILKCFIRNNQIIYKLLNLPLNIYCNLNIILFRKEIEMNITDKALVELQPILDENPDKLIRVLFQGFG